MASKNVFMLTSRMTPPTAVPRTRVGSSLTIKAASGAAMTPPTSSAPTTCQGISAKLRLKRKPRLAHSATTNSLVSTVPMILRGSIRPDERRVGVEMGPHPPPPIASRNPATRPRGVRNLRLMGRTSTGRSFLLKAKRLRTYTPRQNRKIATTGSTRPAVASAVDAYTSR
jgi:hypothetical protein